MDKFRWSDLLEVVFFSVLTAVLYLIFVVNIPIFRDPFGLLVMNDFSELSQGGWIGYLIFGSAVLCALLGTGLLRSVPQLNAGILVNFLAVTYFFIWAQSLYVLSREDGTLHYFKVFILGLVFLYVFLYFLTLWTDGEKAAPAVEGDWRLKGTYYYLWGWLGFYFGLSGILVVQSWVYSTDRFPMALAAMGMGFLNYLLCLFLRKLQKMEVQGFASRARFCFGAWGVTILALWAIQTWVR